MNLAASQTDDPPAPQQARGGPEPGTPMPEGRPNPERREAWAWIPSLYFAEGLPYVMVMSVSVVMYKALGVANDQIALYTSLLYLPWVIKPLWSPVVDVIGTQRRWILVNQLLIAVGFLGIAAVITTPNYFVLSLAFLWLLAFSSATHDIAADGFYMSGLDERNQAWFVGIRSTFYRLAMIAGQGGLVMLAGALEQSTPVPLAWRWAMGAAGLFFAALAAYHAWALPRPAAASVSDQPRGSLAAEIAGSVTTFFRKPGIGRVVAFLLLYRFAEAQLGKISQPFLMDPRTDGGLGLTTVDVGKLYGGVGVVMLLAGGVLGGVLGARYGVRRCLLPMAAAINLPNVVYVFLAFQRPTSELAIGTAVALEQFGYGLGFAGYLLVMLHAARGAHQTAHYALCTGLMALGMMLPGMISGDLQMWLGYQWFFVWIMVATLPSFAVTVLVLGRLAPTEAPSAG